MAKRSKVDHGKPDWLKPGVYVKVYKRKSVLFGSPLVLSSIQRVGRVFKTGWYREGDNRPYDIRDVRPFWNLEQTTEKEYLAETDRIERELADEKREAEAKREQELAIRSSAPKVVQDAVEAISNGYANGWGNDLSDEVNLTRILNTLVRDAQTGL